MELALFLLPAYAADGAAPFAAFWTGPNRPISRSGMGSHKTVLGFALGVAAAVGMAAVVGQMDRLGGLGWSGDAWRLPETGPAWLLHGVLLGVGAMGGDAVASFFKRWTGIAPGRPWMPFDQLDFLAGALLLTWPFVELRWAELLVLAAATFVGHLGVSWAVYRLGIKEDRF